MLVLGDFLKRKFIFLTVKLPADGVIVVACLQNLVVLLLGETLELMGRVLQLRARYRVFLALQYLFLWFGSLVLLVLPTRLLT